MMTRAVTILEDNQISFDNAAVAEVVRKYLPDWRRVINELQRYSATGRIDSGILANTTAESITQLIDAMKDKNFSQVRKWVGQHSDTDSVTLYRQFYDNASQYFKAASIPQLVLILAKYQHQAAFVADHEINNAACMLEIMIDCEFE
jgi:hypothetical protein